MRAGKSRVLLRGLLLAAALALVVRQWIWMPLLVVGNSMQPTLRAGNIVGLNKLAYRFGQPQRGDIVAVWTGRQIIVKRVLALPGEEIGAADGVFSVNGDPLAEPYVQSRAPGNIAPGRLGADRFVVAGDNRQATLIAVVSRDRIVGRVTTWRGSALARNRASALNFDYYDQAQNRGRCPGGDGSRHGTGARTSNPN